MKTSLVNFNSFIDSPSNPQLDLGFIYNFDDSVRINQTKCGVGCIFICHEIFKTFISCVFYFVC